MDAIRFDEERVIKMIDGYSELFGEYPYLVCNKDIALLIQKSALSIKQGPMSLSASSVATQIYSPTASLDAVTINGNTYKLEKNDRMLLPKSFHNAKILIDDELEYGEIHVG